jgi:hypothetical protein
MVADEALRRPARSGGEINRRRRCGILTVRCHFSFSPITSSGSNYRCVNSQLVRAGDLTDALGVLTACGVNMG